MRDSVTFYGTPPPDDSPMGKWLGELAEFLGLTDPDPNRIAEAVERIALQLPRYRRDQIAARVNTGVEPDGVERITASAVAADKLTAPDAPMPGSVFLAWGRYIDGSGSEFFGVSTTPEGAYAHAGRAWIEDDAGGYRPEVVEFGPDGKPVNR